MKEGGKIYGSVAEYVDDQRSSFRIDWDGKRWVLTVRHRGRPLERHVRDTEGEINRLRNSLCAKGATGFNEVAR